VRTAALLFLVLKLLGAMTEIAVALILFFQVKSGISLTGPSLSNTSDPASSGVQNMFIELAVLFAIVVLMGTTVVKFYEWRQDVLYGPYLARERVEQKCQSKGAAEVVLPRRWRSVSNNGRADRAG
jgi:hypothetical protein